MMRKAKPRELQEIVARHFGVEVEHILARDRHKTISLARALAELLCRDEGYSYPEIARAFERRDHTSVLLAIRRLSAQLETDAELSELTEYLRAQRAAMVAA